MQLLDFMPTSLATDVQVSQVSEAATAPAYDLVAVVERFNIPLTPTLEDENWTHCGPSPYVREDKFSLAVNVHTGRYYCYVSEAGGSTIDFVMFMEECSAEEALDWLDAQFPIAGAEVVHQDGPLPKTEPEVAQENTQHVEARHSAGELEDGPCCAYPGFPSYEPITMQSTPDPEGEALAEAIQKDGQPAASSIAVEAIVYQTTNYDLFKLLSDNRPVKPAAVRALVAHIKQKNLLSVRPIDVTADMEVIDGQHRLAAARELGLPVYYKVSEQLSQEDITILNTVQSNWSGGDYLHSWAARGKADYIALADFMQRHPLMSFSNAKMMLQLANKGSIDEFRKGLWVAGDPAVGEAVAELIERIAAKVPTFKQPTHTGFVVAIHHCITEVEGFEGDELIRMILKQPLSLVICANKKQFLQMLDMVYNYGKTADKRLKFATV